MKKVIVGGKVTPEERERIRELAKKKRTCVSTLVRNVLLDHLKQESNN